MFRKVIGFLTIKGWEGVKDIYLLAGIGLVLGIGFVYFALIYHKEYWPKKFELSDMQTLILKIAIAIALLILLLII